MDSFEVVIKIRDLNPHVVCSLCAGYFVEATTITECLHTFCKSCIVKYLQTSKCCPTCNLKIHETQPLVNLKLDRTMQDIVQKVVPGVHKDEEKRKHEFYESRGLPVEKPTALYMALEAEGTSNKPMDATVKRDFTDYRNSYRDDELVSLCIEKHGFLDDGDNTEADKDGNSNDENEAVETSGRGHYHHKTLCKKYVQCSVRMTVTHLQKYLDAKLRIPVNKQVEILCNEHVIQPCRTMKFIWITEWLDKQLPLVLHYRITE